MRAALDSRFRSSPRRLRAVVLPPKRPADAVDACPPGNLARGCSPVVQMARANAPITFPGQ